MTQTERRAYLIEALLAETPAYRVQAAAFPPDEAGQKHLLRALFNVRPPRKTSEDFLRVQDEYLQEELRAKHVTDIADLTPVRPELYLWQGDITALRCGAIVNAANSGMTGCYVPNHRCIDNCIHTYAGVQLRQNCAQLIARQGHEEKTGAAKLTPAYNLPCEYILHTVGPIVQGPEPTAQDCTLLASCYRACLALAEAHNIKSVAFCCISTGEFRFPHRRAAEIAVETVVAYRAEHAHAPEVIFNVFKDIDLQIYRELLARH